jgi:hypothetical protein
MIWRRPRVNFPPPELDKKTSFSLIAAQMPLREARDNRFIVRDPHPSSSKNSSTHRGIIAKKSKGLATSDLVG